MDKIASIMLHKITEFLVIVMYQLQIVINLIEHIPNMYALMIGRILGGLSTSLLFSAFESWMVSEHR
jgi:MFS transporter, MFS domain-containing protein family, molybdate-anion transporter